MRDPRPVLVAALVVAAGCQAALDGGSRAGTETETLTPAPTLSPAADADVYADFAGVSADGAIDHDALVEAHRRALADTSFTVVWSRWRSNASGERRSPLVRRVAAVENATTYRYRPGARVERYADPSGRYARLVLPGEQSATSHLEADRRGAGRRFAGVVAPALRTAFGEADASVVERDGQRYLRLVSREPPEALTGTYGATLGNYSAVALVHPEGYVRALVYRYDVPADGGRAAVSYRFRYRDVGETTVTRPEWVDGESTTRAAGE